MREFAGIVICAALGWVGAASAQSAATTGVIANTLAETAGVPVGTAISDLVTKASGNVFISNLQRAAAAAPQVIARDANLGAEIGKIARSAVKGYTIRDIELDSRFEANIKRVLHQVSLDAIALKSPSTSGLIIPNVSLNQITAPSALPGRSAVIASTAGSAIATASPDVERSNERVWGGAVIAPEADVFRDSVAILGNNKLCSGSLIDGQTVITAGHCYCEGVMEEIVSGTSILSTDRVRVVKDQSQSFRPCEEVDRDPSGGDVALLKLERSLVAKPKPLGTLQVVKDSAAIRAVGFGHTETAIGFKYQVNIVIASHQCDGTGPIGIPDQQVYRCKPAYELVAAGLNRDTCGGDSGGGVYVFGPDSEVYLVGVTSRAVDPTGKCGPGGIYVLLSAPPIRDWLESKGVTF
jgi:hypothetical protein